MYTTTTRALIGYKSLQLCVLWEFEFSSGRIVGHLDFMLLMQPPYIYPCSLCLFVHIFLLLFNCYEMLFTTCTQYPNKMAMWTVWPDQNTNHSVNRTFHIWLEYFGFYYGAIAPAAFSWIEIATFVAFIPKKILFVFAICKVINHTI